MKKGIVFLFFLILLNVGKLSPAEAKDLERFPSQNKVASEVYTVKKGDTFEKLFGEKWRVIARFNRLDKDHLFAGQKIKVPVDLEQAAGYSPLPAFFEEAKNEEKFILVDLEEQWFGAYEFGNLVFGGPISSAAPKCLDKRKFWRTCKTPTGDFKILAVDRDHYSSIYKDPTGKPVPMPYAMMFYQSSRGIAYWLHGGALPGYRASHGCIRLWKEDAQKLCEWFNPDCSQNKKIEWLKNAPKVKVVDSLKNSA